MSDPAEQPTDRMTPEQRVAMERHARELAETVQEQMKGHARRWLARPEFRDKLYRKRRAE